jgi:hypothetical protein
MNALSTWFCEFASSIVGRFTPGPARASQKAVARVLPHRSMFSTQSVFHESRLSERTLLMCVPRLRWMPEHWKQMNWPRLMLAHAFCASFCGQSAQMLLPGCLISAASRFRLRAASFSSAL